MENLEHPGITRTLRDGYERPPRYAVTCSECNEPIYIGDRALHIRGWGWVCGDCISLGLKYLEVDDV